MIKTAEFVKSLVVKAIDDGMPPPNAPSTVDQKGSNHPLVDTGEMRNSIEYRIDGNTIRVGFFDEQSALKAVVNNYGVPGKIPARPFMSATIDEHIDDISKVLMNEMADKILERVK